jgi:DNA-binding protein H-NS
METIEGLKSARQQVAELEREMLEDVQAKATLLGYELVKAEGRPKLQPEKKVKYRGPNGEEWSGKGKRPTWIMKLITDGANLEDFAT